MRSPRARLPAGRKHFSAMGSARGPDRRRIPIAPAPGGVETPLFDGLSLGFGNETEGGPEGYVSGNVLATHVTGPVLVKNPGFTDFLIRRVFEAKGWETPKTLPVLPYEREAYEVTVKELTGRN